MQGDPCDCGCGKPAIVGLQGRWLSLECFDRDTKKVGETVKKLRAAMAEDEGEGDDE